jgi:YVTN family beta-propeller protein
MNLRGWIGWVLALAVLGCAAWFAYRTYYRIPTNVAYVSEEDNGISMIDLNTLEVVKRVHPQNVAPRGLGVTLDGKFLVTANKDTADATVFDTRRRLKLIGRVHLGDNPEFVKIDPTGSAFFVSYEPGSTAGPPKETAIGDEDEGENEPPAEIMTLHTADWSVGRSFIAGKETEGLEFSPDGKQLIVANEAQNTLGVYGVESGKLLREIDLKQYGRRPRGVKVSPQGNSYAVTMEGSGTLLTLDENLNVTHTTPTAAKPYGVAFDPDGRRIFVAAAGARKLQVFSAQGLQLLAETPVGQRCWHFTFTPDASKLLLACGRSNNVIVIDANTYQPIKTIGGFQTPWGIVTYPRAFGSLGLP